MAVQAIGAVASTGSVAPRGAAGAAAPAAAPSADSTIVVGKVTRTNPDGSTVTTITYADGHTKVETTPPKYAAGAEAAQTGAGQVTAVDILA